MHFFIFCQKILMFCRPHQTVALKNRHPRITGIVKLSPAVPKWTIFFNNGRDSSFCPAQTRNMSKPSAARKRLHWNTVMGRPVAIFSVKLQKRGLWLHFLLTDHLMIRFGVSVSGNGLISNSKMVSVVLLFQKPLGDHLQ